MMAPERGVAASDGHDSGAGAAFSLARLAALLVFQRNEEAAGAIRELRADGTGREAVREAILQTYLHDGYPTALEGMILLGDVWPGDPAPVEEGDYGNWEEWDRRGRELYERIYGSVAEPLRSKVDSLSPELARWMIVEGYGKVLSRGVLADTTRELISVAVLASKARLRQLHSHLRGALRVGCDSAVLDKLLRLIVALLGPGEGEKVLRLWDDLQQGKGGDTRL